MTTAFRSEIEKRDDVLDALEVKRARLIAVAKMIAKQISDTKGEVTSGDVLKKMRALNISGVHDVDARFMGSVFRKGWTRKCWRAEGSHARPVSVWVKA